MNFQREEYHLMIILPSKLTGMRITLESLTDDRLLSYLGFQAMDTELLLPKFKIRADTDLAVVLKEVSLHLIFRSASILHIATAYLTFEILYIERYHSVLKPSTGMLLVPYLIVEPYQHGIILFHASIAFCRSEQSFARARNNEEMLSQAYICLNARNVQQEWQNMHQKIHYKYIFICKTE